MTYGVFNNLAITFCVLYGGIFLNGAFYSGVFRVHTIRNKSCKETYIFKGPVSSCYMYINYA